MLTKLEVHPEVYEELEEARSWYDEHTPGLGKEFLDEIERAVSTIQKAPEAWPVYSNNVRRFLVHRFPFAILYRYGDSKIQIIAAMHQRRRPDYWKGRKFS